MTSVSKTAGGRAAEAGMSFQAAVTAWIAAHLATDMPIGGKFGLTASAKAVSIQCETGDAVDDVVARLEGSGTVYIQCKTRPGLTRDPDHMLGKAIAQLVRLHLQLGSRGASNPEVAAVLAVSQDAPASLAILEAACRQFDRGGDWATVAASQPKARAQALELFEHLIRAAWPGAGPTGRDLENMARLFRITRFSENATGADWREAAGLLGRRLYGDEAAGAAPMASLFAVGRQLIRSGATADRSGLLRALRAEGHVDTLAPGYDDDIAAVSDYSNAERARLAKHTRLPIGEGIPIPRDCLKPLAKAVSSGSLLVTGEPGAGKTGVLLALANLLATDPATPAVFLSVERFAGFRTQADFSAELRIRNGLLDVLANWPGLSPGVLMIDALDASRGGQAESVIANFVADALTRLGDRWSIVASIRSFDLRNGRRFREVMPGTPPDPVFMEPGLDQVRHFQVPRLSRRELDEVSAASDQLRELVLMAPPKLKDLLANVFNLSLAADLLNSGTATQSIREVRTQSQLIQRYEDDRLTTHRLQLAANDAVTAMVGAGQLTVRQVAIRNEAVQEVLQAGVLVSAGDRVAFAHHVLFDHVAGRFFLPWDNLGELYQRLSADAAAGLLLAPAVRFALELAWEDDRPGRRKIWAFLSELTAVTGPDPVAISVALRTAAERVETAADVAGLCALVRTTTDRRATGNLLGRLARFVGLMLQERGGSFTDAAAIAWADVALAAAEHGDVLLTDGARVLLFTLGDAADLHSPKVLAAVGEASRALLRTAWSVQPDRPPLTSAGIRMVTKSFGSDSAASRVLLERILEESRLSQHAAEEAPRLAEGIGDIARHDPAFVARIYATIFTFDCTDDEQTLIGGVRSKILPLTISRKQQYQNARLLLNEGLAAFIQADTAEGTRAVIGAVRGLAAERSHGRRPKPGTVEIILEGGSLTVVDDRLSLTDWRDPGNHHSPDEEVLPTFVEFLRNCTPKDFRVAVDIARDETTPGSVWSRLLGVAADRGEIADVVLWPLATTPRFSSIQCIARDAIVFLAAAYPRQTADARRAFEVAALAPEAFSEDREVHWWRHLLDRFLSVAQAEYIETAEMRALRQGLQAEDKLIGNPPFVNIKVGWGPNDDVVDGLLRSEGADLERSTNREIRAAMRTLEDLLVVVATPDPGGNVDALRALWQHTCGLIAVVDSSSGPEAHSSVLHASWGVASNAVERIAGSPAYSPGTEGHPDLPTLLRFIARLAASSFPEPNADDEQSLGWGNWDVRVYAASSLVALAPRFGRGHPEILDRLAECLKDPVTTVRLQVVRALNVLWDVARERMWEMIAYEAANERSEGVLSFLIGGPLAAIAHADAQRSDDLLSRILESEWATPPRDGSGRDRDAEASASLAARLFVAHDQPKASAWIRRWASDLRRGETYLTPMLASLRPVLFIPYGENPKPGELEMVARGRWLLDLALASATAALDEARPHLRAEPGNAAVALWRPLYVAGDGLLATICQQLYFGSGAFRSERDRDRPGLATAKAKLRFLSDYGPVLDRIGAHATGRTVHYMVELLGYLIEGDPSDVFDRLAKLLLGAGAEDNYQSEVLASDCIVKLFRRYLADHRDIFQPSERRRTLVSVLEQFSSAGWPDALKLLFELPDLLR